MFTPDEPSVQLIAPGFTLLFWYGSVSEWRLGLYDERVNQNPHMQFYFGPFSVCWWVKP